MSYTTSLYIKVYSNKPSDIAFVLKHDTNENDDHKSINKETIITTNDLLQARKKGKVQINNSPLLLQVFPSYRNEPTVCPDNEKLSYLSLLSLLIPSMTLLSIIISCFVCDANGWDAVFPSAYTTHLVYKMTVWGTLIGFVAYEQAHFWYGSANLMQIQKNGNHKQYSIGLEVIVYHSLSFSATDMVEIGAKKSRRVTGKEWASKQSAGANNAKTTTALTTEMASNGVDSRSTPTNDGKLESSSQRLTPSKTVENTPLKEEAKSPLSVEVSVNEDPPEFTATPKSLATPSTTNTSSSKTSTPSSPSTPKASPGSGKKTRSITNENTIPFRFIRAEKGDINAAKTRWAETCEWRKELGMDEILSKPHPKMELIKANYPHYFHLRGKKNECCYYERPAQINLSELRKQGVVLEELLRHYALCCEYMWSEIEPTEDGKSIYVIDLDGIGLRDFVGDVVDFVKKASSFTAAHYPERSGSIYIINVPSWFSVIWNAVKHMVDDVTKKKITIMRYGQEAITKALMERINIENIPPEYGGESMPLGQSPEEVQFKKHFEKMNVQ